MSTSTREPAWGRMLRSIGIGGGAPARRRTTYADYDSARSACLDTGYSAGQVEEVVLKKTLVFREGTHVGDLAKLGQSNLQLLMSICLAYADRERPVTVLDFGGACGAHYFIARALFQGRVHLRWLVVETPTMVRFARQLETDDLRFCDSIDTALSQAGQIDVVYSSGALQYVSDPCETLRRLVACGAAQLSLARMGATMGKQPIICIDETQLSAHGPGPMPAGYKDASQRSVYTLPPKTEVDSIVQSKYRLITTLPDDSGIFPINDEPIVGFAYLAETLA